MDKTESLNFGDVVQLDPDAVANQAFAGAFMLVTEPKAWGAQGFVQVLGENREGPGPRAYYRAGWDEMHLIGRAVFVPGDEGGSDG